MRAAVEQVGGVQHIGKSQPDRLQAFAAFGFDDMFSACSHYSTIHTVQPDVSQPEGVLQHKELECEPHQNI